MQWGICGPCHLVVEYTPDQSLYMWSSLLEQIYALQSIPTQSLAINAEDCEYLCCGKYPFRDSAHRALRPRTQCVTYLCIGFHWSQQPIGLCATIGLCTTIGRILIARQSLQKWAHNQRKNEDAYQCRTSTHVLAQHASTRTALFVQGPACGRWNAHPLVPKSWCKIHCTNFAPHMLQRAAVKHRSALRNERSVGLIMRFWP